MNFKSYLMLATCITLWGFMYPISKYIVLQLSPCLAFLIRFIVISLFFLPITGFPQKKFLKIALLSFAGYVLNFTLMGYAIRNLDAAIAAILIELEVPFVFVLGAIFLREKVTIKKVSGLFISFFGVYILFKSPDILGGGQQISAIMICLGALSYSISCILLKKLNYGSGLAIAVWQALFSIPQFLILTLLLEENHISQLQSIDLKSFAGLLYVSFSSVLCFGMWNSLMKKYPVSQILPFSLLIPILATLAGYLVLDEILEVMTIVGAIIAIIGVGIQTIKFKKDKVIAS